MRGTEEDTALALKATKESPGWVFPPFRKNSIRSAEHCAVLYVLLSTRLCQGDNTLSSIAACNVAWILRAFQSCRTKYWVDHNLIISSILQLLARQPTSCLPRNFFRCATCRSPYAMCHSPSLLSHRQERPERIERTRPNRFCGPVGRKAERCRNPLRCSYQRTLSFSYG